MRGCAAWPCRLRPAHQDGQPDLHAGLVQGRRTGHPLAKKVGLDVDAVIATISKGAAQSWQMENRYKTMNEGKYDHGFAVEWMRKDLSICLGEARRNGASLPVTKARRPVLRAGRKWRPPLGHPEPAGAVGALGYPCR